MLVYKEVSLYGHNIINLCWKYHETPTKQGCRQGFWVGECDAKGVEEVGLGGSVPLPLGVESHSLYQLLVGFGRIPKPVFGLSGGCVLQFLRGLQPTTTVFDWSLLVFPVLYTWLCRQDMIQSFCLLATWVTVQMKERMPMSDTLTA